jgi:hypothetical protein
MIAPMPIIALTPTTRVRHFTHGHRHAVAVWRGFRLVRTITKHPSSR